MRPLLALTIVLLPLAGCGNSRTPVPQIGAPAAPGGFRTLSNAMAGVTLSLPRSWVLLHSSSPLLLVLASSGNAVVALWRYPLSRTFPATGQALRLARQRLIASARTRDHSLALISASLTRVDGRPAVTLEADEHIGRRVRRVLSTHVFNGAEELVLEEYAPVQIFAEVNRAVFSPVRRSLTLAPG